MDESVSSSSPSPPQPTINLQQGDLVWFDAGFNFPLAGEIVEVHRAAQIVIVSAIIDGKVSKVRKLLLKKSRSKPFFPMMCMHLHKFHTIQYYI